MKKLIYLFIVAITVSIIVSCGKDGATGPAGANGATGSQGPVGPAGPAGANGSNGTNGSVIYSGTTVPGASTGAIGDFYIDLTTSVFYGPKSDGGWGSGVSLAGATGATGATGAKGATGTAGSKIYSGSGVPSNTLGTTNDYYLDITSYKFYGPKTSAGWGAPISLQGPAGPKGATGATGATGPQGPPGNANVSTTTFSVTNAQWLWNSDYEFQTNPSSFTEYFTRYCDNTVTGITQDILDNGAILVYFTPNTTDNTNQWAPMPYEFTDASGNFNYEMAYETNVGTVRLHYFFVQTNPAATIPTLSTYTIATYKFKVVVIAGSLNAAMKQNHININDYNAVSQFISTWQNSK